MDVETIKEQFIKYLDEKLALARAVELMGWDAATGAPKGGASSRSKTRGVIAAKEFAMTTSDDMARFLDALGGRADELDTLTLGLYKRCKKEYDALVKIPVDEYEKYARLTGEAEAVWENAKRNDDFAAFAPFLSEIITYNRRFIEYRGFSEHPYDTLLDDFEPGVTVRFLDAHFESVKASIAPLIRDVTRASTRYRSDFVNYKVSEAAQRKIALVLTDKLGYDMNRGLLRESEHPFTCSFGKNDARVTTHYYENNFFASFYSVIHEVGHAIYEQNKSDDIADTFMDDGASMGIHESQSRFYENIIGRSESFWKCVYGDIADLLGGQFKGVSAKDLYIASNLVKPGPIRIEADELTYPLHILIRYEMEKEALARDIDVNSLPGLWNEKYEAYLGVVPKNDAEGILQDVHWSDGSFGYFPSYSLGNAYAAQLFYAMRRDIDVFVLIEQGEISAVNGWLRDKIHKFGALKTPSELIEDATGEPPDVKHYIDYLTEKFTKLYSL
ncbi:MAG: carboxypeptidase M32 [Clostridiales bacterium]|jgi:carboxypeptidase Taq|nr:carboxypeptidase M32 [Clostridiales bacterium]